MMRFFALEKDRAGADDRLDPSLVVLTPSLGCSYNFDLKTITITTI